MRMPWILSTALLLTPTISQAKTLEELLVEKGVLTKEEVAATSAPAKISWNDGTKIEFPEVGFATGAALFLVERYTYTDNPSGKSDTSSFDQNKARLVVNGYALDKRISYLFVGDFVGEKEDGRSETSLKDAYVQWNPQPNAGIRMGQYKTLISKQWNIAEHKLQLPDRSIASQFFMLDRNQGVTGSWSTGEDRLVAKAAFFNGDSTGEGPLRAGVDTLHSGMTSLRFNPIGKYDVGDETDLLYTEDIAASFGAAYAFSSSRIETSDEDDPLTQHADLQRLSVDAGAKLLGLSAVAEFFWGQNDWEDSETANPVGFYAQAGYFVMPKTIEVAARYSLVDCDDGRSGGNCAASDSVDEVGLGVNYYPWKHNLKLQAAYFWVTKDPVEGEITNTDRVIAQVSSYF